MDDTESIVRREFDAKAAVYESNRLAPWYMAHADQLLKHLSLQGSDAILDIGCGTGYLLRQVAKSRPGVIGIGVDIAPRMVEMARDKAAAETLPNLAFVRSDWECLTGEARALLAKQPIACAVCASTFHYFKSPAAATRAIYDVLRPGGALLILERARENSLLTGFWHFLHKYLIGDSVHFYTSDEIAEIAEQSGFHEVRVIAQLRRVFWKNKLYTSLVLVQAVKE